MNNQLPRKTIKIRRSTEQWQAIMLAFADSGLTQEAFCAQESLAMSTFSKWRHKLTSATAHVLGDENSPMFVDLTRIAAHDRQHSVWDIKLSLGEGMSLKDKRGVRPSKVDNSSG